MAQLPPPPPPRPDVPDPHLPGSMEAGGQPRPQLVTAAGVILIVLGGLGILGGLLLLGLDADTLSRIGNVNIERLARGLSVLAFGFGGLEVLAGVLVLRLSNAGRILGLVLACIGLVGGLGSLGDGAGVGLLSLGLNGFTVYALISNADVFARSGGR